MAGNPKLDSALEGIDEPKRATLRRLIDGGSFVAPIVASFAMSGLTIDSAAAIPVNTTATTASGKHVTQTGDGSRPTSPG